MIGAHRKEVGPIVVTLGEKLAAAREARRWSLRYVEAKTGVHNAHLWQIEKGVITRPDPNILWSLATAYDLDFDELMRLAGHVEAQEETNRGSYGQVAWRSLRDLSPKEQRQVLQYIKDLKRDRAGPT
jgi:transcriptional regulator with XRE-family HTH domain